MHDLHFNWLRRNEGQGSASPLLQIRALRVRVGIRHVLEDVNLEVRDGDVVYVTGSNGSGKSTLLNAIAGLEPARVVSGNISFRGTDITDMQAHERAQLGIGYLRQRENVFADLTVGENLRLALGSGGYKRFQEAYPELAAALPVNKRVSLLSGGQKQRLAWAMATLRESRMLLADEPEAGLSHQLHLPESGTFVVASHSLKR